MKKYFSNHGGFFLNSSLKVLVLWLILVFTSVLFLSACSAEEKKSQKQKEPVSSPMVSFKPSEKTDASVDLSTAIVRIAKQTIPAVAHVEVTESQEVANPLLPFESDPFFRHFFNFPKMPRKFKRKLKGLGSGIIMDPKGYILTNNHVVGGATKIQVLLADGEEYPAKIVGTDPKTDLAVIKISAKEPLPYVSFGDSDKMEVGEWVVAIGHPRGLDQTVTQGIISAKHRRGIMDPSSYQDFLQTDAAINPGNSGGPLLNIHGEVIGVNAAIVSESGGFEGIGFAIPSRMALYISKQLIAHGKVKRGWLGVTIQDVTQKVAKSLGIERARGALIVGIVKGGPADRAGLKKGDIVAAYDGKEITNSSTLQNAVAIATIGEKVKLSIIRSGKKQEITVKIGDLDDAIKYLSSSVKERLGVEARSLTSKEAEKYGFGSPKGVLITSVDPKGPLGKVGFEVGDIILKINGQPIDDLESFAAIVNLLQPHQNISVLAFDHRTGEKGYVKVTVK